MAATALSTGIGQLVNNGALTDVTPQAIDSTNGNMITGAMPERIILKLITAGASGMTVAIKAGGNPPYPSAAQGDLTVTLGASATRFVGPFTSARFLQSDGSLMWTYSGVSGTCTVAAYKLPAAPAGPRG